MSSGHILHFGSFICKKQAPSVPTVYRWTIEYKHGCTSINNNPLNVEKLQQHQTIEQIHHIVHEDPTITMHDTAKNVGISDMTTKIGIFSHVC